MARIASCAISLDGYLDDTSNTRLILSSEEDFAVIHKLRAKAQAIVIGAETLRTDNPSLTARLPDETLYPDRVVFTRQGNIDFSSKFFCDDPARKIIFTTTELQNKHELPDYVTVHKFNGDLKEAIDTLDINYGLQDLLIEGGTALMAGFGRVGVLDSLRLAIAPKIVGQEHGRGSISKILGGIKESGKILSPRPPTLLGDTTVIHYDIT